MERQSISLFLGYLFGSLSLTFWGSFSLFKRKKSNVFATTQRADRVEKKKAAHQKKRGNKADES
jgi:hypothetical protein